MFCYWNNHAGMLIAFFMRTFFNRIFISRSMPQARGYGKTRIINGETYRLSRPKVYGRTKATHVAAGHRGIGRKARLIKVTCPKGRKAYAVYVRGRRQ